MAPVVNNTTPNRQRSKAAPYMPSYMGDGQLCVVCGDQATGLHYRAITCEGCKGFFRRTSQRHLEYECKNGEQCEVSKQTRNVCQRCRYLKCIMNGMTSDLVLNDEERVQKRELIKGNRERRRLEHTLHALKSPGSPENNASTNANNMQKEINRITAAFCKLVDTSFPSHSSSPLSSVSPTSADNRLADLIRPIVHRNTLFAQSLSIWIHLPVSSQSQLLNSSMLDVQLLRFLSFFDSKEHVFHINGNVIDHQHLIDLLGLDIEDDNEELQRLIESMFRLGEAVADLEMNEDELALITAILVFNPDNLDLGVGEVLTLTCRQLYEMLYALTEDISDGDVYFRWPKVISRISQIRLLSARLAPHVNVQNVDLFGLILSI